MSSGSSQGEHFSFAINNSPVGQVFVDEDSMDTASESGVATDVELYFVFKEIRYALFVNIEDAELLKYQRDLFIRSLASMPYPEVYEPRSAVEVTLQFLQFLIDGNAPKSSIGSLLLAFDREFLLDSDVHTLASKLPVSPEVRRKLLRTYYTTTSVSSTVSPRDSALLKAASAGEARIYSTFGGQGTTNSICFKELSDLYATYTPFLHDLINATAPLLNHLSHSPETRGHYYGRYIDVQTWIQDPSSIPDAEFIATAAVSLPIIGLLSLAHYCVSARVLEKTPGELTSLLQGATGHSQGIAIAVGVAVSDSWESFYKTAKVIIEILFWIGLECHQNAPRSLVSAALTEDGLQNSQGQPSCMLSVRGLQRIQVEALLSKLNKSLAADEKVYLALTNSRDNFVIAGPANSLVHLNSYIQSLRADPDLDQGRIPFSSRKPEIQHQFLPISAPFHTRYLQAAAENAKLRLAGKVLSAKQLKIPVFHSNTGCDLRTLGDTNLVDVLVDAITCEPCDWPTALGFPNASHIISFGSGGISDLIMKVKEGQGVRVINGSDLRCTDDEMGTKADLFSPQLLESSTLLECWAEKYQPRLVKSHTGETKLETKLSKLLGTPPIMVAGMTPTTVHWDFVSAIMNAGYYAELAAGGYYNAASMSTAILKLIASVPAGRGVTCNLIYAAPQAMSWQLAMLRRLSQDGAPIDGLTIGAGVPSPEIVAEWITTLGLKHISFKPGSISAVKQVIEIAKAHPDFPIILQWTGGRGGGHHSFEDFHVPIIATYGAIRKCANIILVAGSGFGGSKDTYPYLSGSWSKNYGIVVPMPFDGVLLGSRMMVAREAHTSPAAKQLIFDAVGVTDSEWEKSYTRPTGGIITVQSEMGQPIHKIANRGVLLWAEMDKTIFSIPRKERVSKLNDKRDYIIKRLNADFAKPWFGESSEGEAVDLLEMTYAEVLRRTISLMYVASQKRWIDKSYVKFVFDFAVRTLERLPTTNRKGISLSMLSEPFQFLEDVFAICPKALTQIINPEDASYFLLRCKSRGQKPINFIPSLDEDFETYFKKDSLWQSEDVDAVISQDAGRVCILHGPMAARYSRPVDESAKEILDNITNNLVDMVQQDYYPDGLIMTPLSGSTSPDTWSGMNISDSRSQFSGVATPDVLPGWAQAIFSDEFILQGFDRKPSPFRRLLQAGSGIAVIFDRLSCELTLTGQSNSGAKSFVKISCQNGTDISVDLYQPSTYSTKPSVLPFKYRFDSNLVPYRLIEVMEHRNERIKQFYSSLWYGEDLDPTLSVNTIFYGEEITLTKRMRQDLISTIGFSYPNCEAMVLESEVFPISIGIIIGWDVITSPLVLKDIDGDLLRLVHQSNSFEYCERAAPLRVGDVVASKSKIKAVYIEDAGKYVIVEGQILRQNKPVMVVTSTFLFLGSYNDFETTFKKTTSPDIIVEVSSSLDEALLRDREWFLPYSAPLPLVGKTLVFRLQTEVAWKDKRTFAAMKVTGPIYSRAKNNDLEQIGNVNFDYGECVGNPVLDFLERKGSSVIDGTDLKNPGWFGVSSFDVKIPTSNEKYAKVSMDYNPIHVSPIFAKWANLPGTITHGMYTSAVTAGVLEHLGADGDYSRFHRFSANFTGMVLPEDKLSIKLKHTGMIEGRMIFKVTAHKTTGEKVIDADAELDQATTAYIFTGQGSQSKAMGMDLYNISPVAKAIWDDVDNYLYETYGWSIIHIIRDNPKELTVHFGGKRGRKIRDNYLAMEFETTLPDGSSVKKPILEGLTDQSKSHTFYESSGLLYSTQFAQPAIMLFQQATFEHLRSNGFIQNAATYAGHSLGEYGALSAFSGFMPIRSLMKVVFFRGLTMQVSIERDKHGETNFSMAAANPKRVGKFFDENALRRVVRIIAAESKSLLEIVNFNVDGEQYVCAGTLQNLYVLGEVLNHISKAKDGKALTADALQADDTNVTGLNEIIAAALSKSSALPKPIQLSRGVATIPLKGIDVPFHSTHLRVGVSSNRKYLKSQILEENIDPKRLVGRWVPNVMAKPFSLDESYVREAYRLTQSPVLKEVLEQMVAC